MKTREEALKYGLSFEGAFHDAPFHDDNWQLVRYAGNKKAFLWTYEKDGFINLNVKVDPEKAFFWRDMYKAVVPGYHQNKDNWNTVILDGSIPDKDIKMMIAESYDLVSYSPSKTSISLLSSVRVTIAFFVAAVLPKVIPRRFVFP